MLSILKHICLPLCVCSISLSYGQTGTTPKDSTPPPPPMLLEKSKREAGNPLATYEAMLRMEKQYRASPMLSGIYDEQRLNLEEFLGVPDAGNRAMQLPMLKANWKGQHDQLPPGYGPINAIDVIREEATKTKVVIWAEEHHLPQTRSLYESMLTELWKLGYRYLACEAFSDKADSFKRNYVDYSFGYYTQDPVYASAVNLALHLGYKLVSYDTREVSATEPSFRDIRQAENIQSKILSKDPDAKVLVFAGRGHASEAEAPGGWKPMGSVLKRITGIDPFTVFAVTMTERLSPEEEHPYYRDATARGWITAPAILKDTTSGKYLGTETLDAYVFFPRVHIANGRPDWLVHTMHRKEVTIPKKNLSGSGLRLVQAFCKKQPVSTVPMDQVLLFPNSQSGSLVLPKGRYRIRTINPEGNIVAERKIRVKKGGRETPH